MGTLLSTSPKVTQEQLKTLLDYDPRTGVFRWREGRSNIAEGDVAGCKRKDGYILIGIDGIVYLAHRLAWLYMQGKWPPRGIDHRNTDKGDNRWRNLRLATTSQNNCNARARGKIPFKGVSRKRNKFKASIWINKKHHWLGCFDTPEEAHVAYCLASKRLHGEFSRTL
jgi:hypothetical protein